MIDRKSGIRKRRRREAKRLVRDRKIYRRMRIYVARSEWMHKALRHKIEPASIYLGKPGAPKHLTRFPMRAQPNRLPLPQWKDLSAWMKVQMLTAVLNQWELLTFNVIIHTKLETKWVNGNIDPRVKIRDRIRRELDKAVGARREFFFVWKDGARKIVRM